MDRHERRKRSRSRSPSRRDRDKYRSSRHKKKSKRHRRSASRSPKRSRESSSRKPALSIDQEVTSTEEEKEKRRQRLKAWQAERKKVVAKIKPSDAKNPITTAKLWTAAEEESKKPAPLPKLTDEITTETNVSSNTDEIDPLDTYMLGLQGAEAQEQFDNTTEAQARLPKAKLPVAITLEEIQGETTQVVDAFGSFMPRNDLSAIREDDVFTNPVKSSFAFGGVTPGRQEETEEQREIREAQEHREFMEAIKMKNKLGGSVIIRKEDDEEEVPQRKQDKLGRIYQGTDEDAIGEEADNVDHRTALDILQEAQKKKEIKEVNHAEIDYMPFRKKFYIVPKELKVMSEEQVERERKSLEIKVRGKGCPRPISKWTQCGLSERMLRLIAKHGFKEPFAIQRQALPAVMSGRDVIGIAKTGSGKTLAFLLPMFRHVLDQPPLKDNEGPIGLIMAPARELAQQIYVETKKFCKDLGLRATAVYGGSSVSDQIANLKRGSDVVICTPGRMIDIMCMSAGRLMSLKRVSYVVLDEADRMFDMGFEPQIAKILGNIRPDRQTLLFSATFPRAVESLARKALTKPVEITVGTRSTASSDITQFVEVRDEDDKFMRLLQLLGDWYEKGNVLVFVNTQQACDLIFQDLMKAGYPALSLHGGKDQMDRDYTIDDFKKKARTLMVATSVAGRGLDVKDLVLVINYHCPNHLEDYVHRVGRTGRAGNKGTAYTFISPDEEEYAPDLVKALENANQNVPIELKILNEKFKEKVKRGQARYHGSGFKGKGYTFDENEKTEAQKIADMQQKQYEIEQGMHAEDEYRPEEEEEEETKTAAPPIVSSSTSAEPLTETQAAVQRAQLQAAALASGQPLVNFTGPLTAAQKAQQIANMLDRQFQKQRVGSSGDAHFMDDLEINDYPQQARWKVTQKEAADHVADLTGAAIIARGSYVAPGRKPNAGERKLYLAIEGSSWKSVQEAKRELQRILDETTLQVGLGTERTGKYSI